ncbi:MAG: hypothetical protein QOE73_1248 [Verrucomicrobiota bacterium]
MWWRRRWRGSWCSARCSRCGRATGRRRRSNLITNFSDPSGTDAIESRDDVTVKRQPIRAEGDLHVGIFLVQSEKRGKDLIVRHVFAVNVSRVAAQNLNSHHARIRRLWNGDGRGKVHTNAFHVGLAQAHHHETGEQKEHDVDQRNNLDARSFLRNGRSDFHFSRTPPSW